MKIADVRDTDYCLPLRRAWSAGRYSLRERRGSLLRLTTDDGLTGFGDCAPLHEAGTETPPEADQWLKKHAPALRGREPREILPSLPSGSRAARCGLETALLDLVAQSQRTSLRKLLASRAADQVRVNAVLGALDHSCPDRVRQAMDRGFNVLKLKVGLSNTADELKMLEGLSGMLEKSVALRLDANRAWSEASARAFLVGIEGLPIESLEEPLRDPSFDKLEELQAIAPCPLALDETLGIADTKPILVRKPVARLIIKPVVLGGLVPALELARRAQEAGIECVVTSTIDSAAGIWAAAQLAAAVDATGPSGVHGLATSGWLVRDLGPAPALSDGVIRLSDEAGLGFHPYSKRAE